MAITRNQFINRIKAISSGCKTISQLCRCLDLNKDATCDLIQPKYPNLHIHPKTQLTTQMVTIIAEDFTSRILSRISWKVRFYSRKPLKRDINLIHLGLQKVEDPELIALIKLYLCEVYPYQNCKSKESIQHKRRVISGG